MKLSRTAFLKELAAFAAEQRRLIETQVTGFDTDSQASKARVEKAKGDFRFFCRKFFPHYIQADQQGIVHESEFHGFVYDEIPKLVDANQGCKAVMAAPRGEAKSTLLTQLLTLWCIITERKHFIVILMDSFDQASMMLEAIKAELEANPRLRQDYPQISGAGRVWQAGVIVTCNNIKLQVAGSGKKVRGWRHGPYRPDLVILDDIENDENIRQKAQRDKTEAWVNKAVLKLGPPDGSMDIVYIGTVLHYDSVLNRTLAKPTWQTRLFKAIVQWPDRLDLWDRWEEVLVNDGELAADTFYRRRKKIMNAGAVVSWPGVRSLEMLMKIRADDHHAFDCEYQNDPTDSENAPFKNLQFWVHEVNAWLFFGACDPSLGKRNKARDPSAILVGGINKKTGILDVVEADIRRRVPDLIIARIIDLQRDYHCLLWGIETIQFQEFLMSEIIKRSAALGVPVPAHGLTPNTDKALRIESLQPHVSNGLIRLHRSQTTLIEQLRHYPEADHDDGPDALHMLWNMAVQGAGGIPKVTSRKQTSMSRYANYY